MNSWIWTKNFAFLLFIYFLNPRLIVSEFLNLLFGFNCGISFDVDGLVTGFGNPDWARTHSAATSTAPAVLAILRGGATCVGKTVMDEMAYR